MAFSSIFLSLCMREGREGVGSTDPTLQSWKTLAPNAPLCNFLAEPVTSSKNGGILPSSQSTE